MESDEEAVNKWKININDERKYWKNYVLKYYIYIPEKCPQCSSNKYSIGNLNNILNPIRYVCNNYKCRYRCSLQKFSFLCKFPRIPASVYFLTLCNYFF